MSKKLIVGLDFDGTLVKHAYPDIGEDIGAFPILKKYAKHCKYILFTMRSGETLEAAVEYINRMGIALYGINKNPSQKCWTSSPKAYCHLYIDDAALGAPLIRPLDGRPYINWHTADTMLGQAIRTAHG